MDSSEIYDHALTNGWILAHEGDYVHVYEKDISDHGEHSSRKYVFVAFRGNGDYDGDGSRLILPHKGDVIELDDDEDAKVLSWWLDGNEGSEDDWWNQLSDEEQKALV